MATSFTGSLGQTNNYSSITELITQWPTATQNQGIQLSGIAFDGVETNYTNPTVISNLTLATNENPKSGLSYGAVAGIGVPGSYSGWFTDPNKIRAEINYDPNTNQSQVLKVKWADNKEITSATINLSGLLPKSSLVVDDQGNEAGVLQLFKDGAPVSPSNFTIARLNPSTAPQAIVVSSTGVSFIGDRIDGNFEFTILGDSLTGATFDELRFSATAFNSPSTDYLGTSFKDDSSDYLVRKIEYQGISVSSTSPSLFQFQQPNYTVAEGSAATINVIRTGGTAAASINYATVDGTASSAGTAADYTTAAGVLNFAAGQTTASFTVTALSDLILESSPETVSLVLSGTNASTNPSILTINDVPPTPTPPQTSTSLFQFAQPNYTVAEGSAATINVIRTGGTEAASINYATLDGTASSAGTAADYTSAAGLLNFSAGQTTASFTVTALTDSILESSPETVNLVFLGGNVGSNPSILTINDVPPPPGTNPAPTPTSTSLFQFAQPNYTVAEGSAATINVTRTGGTEAASINYRTLDGTASSAGTAADYTSAAGLLNFAAGQTTASFTVTALTDSILESSPETVNLVLLGGNVGSNPSILTINDVSTGTALTPTSPSLFQFAQPNYTVAEGSVATINVTRTGGTAAATISYATVDGSASSAGTAADYTTAAGVLNFGAGQTTASFSVTTLSDMMLESSPETVNLVLFGGNVSSPSKLTINDVPPPTPTLPSLFRFAQPNYTVAEGGAATITVTRTGGTAAATINYQTLDGSASSGGSAPDYTTAAGVLNFAAGQTTASFSVTTLSDMMLESSPETVNLVLFGGNVSSPALLRINDVPPPTPTLPSLFQFAQPNYTVAEGGAATITVTRTGGTGAATINYQTLDGSASSEGSAPDYTTAAGVLSFAAGQTTASFSVTALSDMMLESSPETVNLVLFGGNVSTPSILTINDVPPTPGTTPAPTPTLPSLFQFAQPNYTVAEGDAATITVTRTGGTAAESINYQTLDGSASSEGSAPDYTTAAGTLNFAAGQTTASFTVTTLSDMMLESSPETVNLVLFGGNVSTPSILTINDVPPPDLTSPSLFQFAQPNYTVAEGDAATITVTRTGGTGAATISYATLDGSASSAGSAPDYTTATGELNFAAGQTTASFTVTALSDMMLESSPETVNLVLFGGNVSTPSLLTINDVPPTPGTTPAPTPTLPSLFQFAQPNYTVVEGDAATINVTRTGGTEAASIKYATVDASASSAGSAPDYTTAAGTLNFAAGQTTASFTVATLSDMMLESSPETVNLVLFGGYVSTPSLLTINDVPPPDTMSPSSFQFAQENYTVAEGDVATIIVTRTGGLGVTSVSYGSYDGTAKSGGTAQDYTGAGGILNFAEGQTTASFTVATLSDMMLESSPETVFLALLNDSVDNFSQLTINDVPPTPGTTPAPTPTLPSLFQFAQPNYTVAEGDAATINVTRTGGTAAATINYATVDGSASSAGSVPDYTTVAGTLNFAAGQTTASFTVTTLSDMMLESSPETVNLVLFGGNVSTPALLRINDVTPLDTTSPSSFDFSQLDYTVAEGDVATITVTRTGGLGAASINYSTLDGSADPSADYTPVAGVLNFGVGETSASFTVATVSDAASDSGEFVYLGIFGGNVSGLPSKLTINDVPPSPMPFANRFQFAQANYIDPSFAAPTSFFYGSSPDPIIDGGSGVVTTNRTANTSVGPSVDYLIAGPGGGQPVNNADSTIVSSFPVSPTGDTVNFNLSQTRVSRTINNPLGLASGPVNLGFDPGANVANGPNTQITLL